MSDASSTLRGRIADRSARIGIVGLGYVGLPTAVALAEAGFDVTGIDCDESRALGVNAGRSHVADVGDARVAELVRFGRLWAVAGIREARDLGYPAVRASDASPAWRLPATEWSGSFIAMSATSCGSPTSPSIRRRSLIMISGLMNCLPRPRVRALGTRSARPVRKHAASSRRSAPRPCT
jgi:UDP-glucose/GDP-mannose dehydrogenase family, NAD binding domain